MRINWFCPLPPARTGIAVWAAKILPYFAAEHDVRLFSPETAVRPAAKHLGRAIRYRSSAPPWKDLNSADLTIYHIGNNAEFHADIRNIARVHPGIVVLHDLRLHDFVWMTYAKREQNVDAYLEAVGRWYGEAGIGAASEFMAGGYVDREKAERMQQSYPLTREVVEGSLGVITHAGSALEDMGEMPECPVAPLRFPYVSMAEERYREIAAARRRHGAPYRVLMFGYIQRNRRLGPILEAIAAMPEREHFRVEICGELWDKTAIATTIEGLGLGGLVRVRGYLPDSEIPGAFAEADIALNLRYPTMGEASLSQMEFWDYGLPTLVTRTGWYASLPEDAVCFVSPEHEIEDIQLHLRGFLEEPQRYYGKGEAGRRALSAHDPRKYVQQTVEFAQAATRRADRAAGLEVASRVGREMSTWLDPGMLGHMLDKVSSDITDLFGSQMIEPAAKPRSRAAVQG